MLLYFIKFIIKIIIYIVYFLNKIHFKCHGFVIYTKVVLVGEQKNTDIANDCKQCIIFSVILNQYGGDNIKIDSNNGLNEKNINENESIHKEVYIIETNENKMNTNNNNIHDIKKDEEKIEETKNIYIYKDVKNHDKTEKYPFINYIDEYHLHTQKNKEIYKDKKEFDFQESTKLNENMIICTNNNRLIHIILKKV